VLDISKNSLVKLQGDLLPPNLRVLICRRNQLETLENLPESLVELNCGRNRLSIIPPLPQGLQFFTCDHNLLTRVSVLLPIHLVCLELSNNALTTVGPFLPQQLEMFYCRYNKLISLSQLPENLRVLDVVGNRLFTICKLPSGLRICDVRNNSLIRLPTIPNATVHRLRTQGNRYLYLPKRTPNYNGKALKIQHCYFRYMRKRLRFELHDVFRDVNRIIADYCY
jgi:Leucine-rich repeat (LRR) protein